MLKWLEQIGLLTTFNLRTLPSRKGSVVAAIVGIAGVVAVLVGVLSIAKGFRNAMIGSGSADTAVVVRAGSDSEMTSILSREETRIIAQAPGVARSGDAPLVSPELFVIVNLPKRPTGADANVPMRGVEPPAFALRPEVRVTEGRAFRWGANEVMVGTGAQRAFEGLEIGRRLRFGQSDWEVVGVFEADGGLSESEIWTDAAVLAPAYRRGNSYQIALARLASPGSFQQFKDALTADPRVDVKVVRETDFYAQQSQVMRLIITGIGTFISLLMAAGAIFGALNTMYTAVASRTREIATLKALGFGASPIIFSVLVESLLLAAIGGAAGALLAWAAFDGYQAATMNFQSFSQVAFAFDVDLELLLQGVLYASVIGAIGGLFPAIRAARLPVAMALREG